MSQTKTLEILRMAEVVKKQGGVYCSVLNKEDELKVQPFFTELFWNLFKKNQALCFSLSNQTPQELDSDNGLWDFYTVDSPFEVFSIEVLNGRVTVGRDEVIGKNVNINCILFADAQIPFSSTGGGLWAFVLYEIEDTTLVMVHLCYNVEVDNKENTGVVVKMNGIQFVPMNSLTEIAQKFIARLNTEKAGAVKTNERIKVRNARGENEHYKIRRVIHIVPKDQVSSYAKENKLNIDFSHRWFVRGHWVCFWTDETKTKIDLSKVGKNRAGEYVEVGRTWRTEHIKGPDHKPLIRKTRIVQSPNQNQK
jgi:hypothetical protein